MKARDVFGIIIRTIAIALLPVGLWYLAFAIADACGMKQDTPGEMATYFATGIPTSLLAITMLRCARQIVRFSYPGNKDDSDADSTS